MTANEKRQSVAKVYSSLIGRNYYSQERRDYCFRPYKNGRYYSDCSSSICYSYKEAGQGFGILNTAGIYLSDQLTTVDIVTASGVPVNIEDLRVGDMLEFAGNDSSRPMKIGHVEMVYSIDGENVTLCGHGSGRPSFKSMAAYCKSRYDQIAPGGWRKGLVCVRRYIQDDPMLSGWHEEEDGWRFYLGNTGEPVRNSWYLDEDGKWYWFDGSGRMVTNTWYWYQEHWYYLGPDGAMMKGQITVDGKWYVMDNDGKMVTDPVTLTPDQDGTLRWPGLAE